MNSMEHELYFSFSNPFLDFPYTSNCIQSDGGLPDLSSRGFFSRSILDIVSEDPIAEFEDNEDIFSTLGSTRMPLEAPVPTEANETLVFSSSAMVSEDHNFELLQSAVPCNKLDGLCTSSFTIKEELKEEVQSGYVCANTDGVNSTPAIASGTGSSESTLTAADALNPDIVRQESCCFDGLVCKDKQSFSSLSPSSMFANAITVANVQPVMAEPIYAPIASLERTSSNTAVFSRTHSMSQNNAMVYSLDEHHNHDDGEDGPDNGSKALQNGTLLFTNPEKRLMHRQDLSAEGMETQSYKTQSPLFEVVKVPQTRIIQRSLSSHALGQLHTCNMAVDHMIEMPSLAQTASLCSPSNVMPAHSQLQVTSSAWNCTTTPACSIRRVFSTGDIQTMNLQESGKSPPFAVLDDRNLKVGRYTLEERKNRICRYRQKRTERNFSKKIKYACRKTLADNRLRVRGRFAKNDEMDDALSFHSGGRRSQEDEDEETHWQQRLSSCSLHS